jgi:hypothetical protein
MFPDAPTSLQAARKFPYPFAPNMHPSWSYLNLITAKAGIATSLTRCQFQKLSVLCGCCESRYKLGSRPLLPHLSGLSGRHARRRTALHPPVEEAARRQHRMEEMASFGKPDTTGHASEDK